MLMAMKVAWDINVTAKFKYLAIHIIKLFRSSNVYQFTSNQELAGIIPCQMEAMNGIIGAANATNSTTVQCSQFAWTEGWRPDFFAGDQDYIDSQSPVSTLKRSVLTLDDVMDPEESAHFLAKRTGAARDYTVSLGTDLNGNPVFIVLESWTYPNGQNGQSLVEATGNVGRYTLQDPGDCGSATYIETADPDAAPAWVVEHIFELQTVARVLEFVVSTVLPTVTTGGVTVPGFNSQYPGISRSVFTDWFQTPYENWGAGLGGC
ncbi:hypothetical protein VE02_10129 [Pseudogymnoascus sp. 03VT05]|nr:hypothetical protein VE02_10129 [Pseudogymnoascus sp. 03VT05]